MREEQDPIEFMKKKLVDKKIYSSKKLQSIDDKIRSEISNLAEKAINSNPSNEDDLYTDVLCEDYDE